MSADAIPIQLEWKPISSAAHFFSKPAIQRASTEEPSSDLLHSIRAALQGSRGASANPIHHVLIPSKQFATDEEELAWDTYTVVLNFGGVIHRRLNFEEEGEPIQWACVGWMEQFGDTISPSSMRPSHYTSDTADLPQQGVPPADVSQRPTFGPFSRTRLEQSRTPDELVTARALFVFLRSKGRIVFENGNQYTFNLPFIVRQAWPLFPNSILIQRVLDPAELEEAAESGEPPLPTIFTIVNPFAEATTVGLADEIFGGFDGAEPYLKDGDIDKPLRSVPADEYIVWLSSKGSDVLDDVLVTVNAEKNQLSIWRYSRIQQKSMAVPTGRVRAQNTTKKRSSISGASSRVRPSDLPKKPVNTEYQIPPPKEPIYRQIPSVDTQALPSPAYLPDIDRMRPLYWIERLHSENITMSDVSALRRNNTCAALFDRRWDGTSDRAFISVVLPSTNTMLVFSLTKSSDLTIHVQLQSCHPALAAIALTVTRPTIDDLLVLKPDHTLTLFTHGMCELPIRLTPLSPQLVIPRVVGMKDAMGSTVTLLFANGSSTRTTFNLIPAQQLTQECLDMMALTLPAEEMFTLHRSFLSKWTTRGQTQDEEFTAFREALGELLGLDEGGAGAVIVGREEDPWLALAGTSSYSRFREDPVMRNLQLPPVQAVAPVKERRAKPHKHIVVVLNALHYLAEDLRLIPRRYKSLLRLVPLLCQVAMVVRPEWADYWKRLCPDAMEQWPSPSTTVVEHLDDRLPVWPPDMSAILYGRINNPEWSIPWLETAKLAGQFKVSPSFAFGRTEPLETLQQLNAVYVPLAEGGISTRKRAENAIQLMVSLEDNVARLGDLPLGIAAPLREAARTSQLSPTGDWPVSVYRLIGRNDLAEGIGSTLDLSGNAGYRSVKEHLLSSYRKSMQEHIVATREALSGEMSVVSGVELELEDFTEIRFGQDRRLDEVSRMLCSSSVPTIKFTERQEPSEADQVKEQQQQVSRMAEKTLALPLGRALFTFGSTPTVTREAYSIPKMEYAVRLQPPGMVIAPEAGKISPECTNWGEFHNGVAAGLRISSVTNAVESSWIKFNKPSELTPQHAGFLFALGLTGHLKEMLTWHTFGYLTPKHDLTSIAVLLGLSAANAGSSNNHVTKLLSVHTPALLPTPNVDLNVPLIIQAAGISGIGLLYMGTKNRRMAEVCLSQISREDLVQPDLSNEYREAYTLCAALAFGMIMLGKGTAIPADLVLLSRLRVLIYGDANRSASTKGRPSFDINLTSPAATIALGLMYLKTGRQDVADVLTIPDTVLALNHIQPNFLLLRTLSRALIMWDTISPNSDWLTAQIPQSIAKAMQLHLKGKPIDDAFELAYYNILAACCFAIGLKYAGTAREEAYSLIIVYYDSFSRLAYTTGPAFDHKIKRSAIRDGLNLISISLNMIMAGTGEINCLRRIRYAYGMYNHAVRYGTYVATHVSLGLLFLGGGRYTLGTSDAAIACMIAAFFPRFAQVPSDNKSYLQALRHLWVLAVEPRCLVARDVDTKEVVYLPVKIKVKEGSDVGTTQLIAPTLIPDLDKLLSIRVDTPRYWPFYLDIANSTRHKESLLRSQTLYVKRRTAFLSYMEDPKGSRSLFVRSKKSTGDAVTLDFPQLLDTSSGPANDLNEFISSFSNDTLFLAFADRFCREDGYTADEKLFRAYCHASLLDSILQDKSQTMQAHLTLYYYRTMSPRSQYFNLRLQDLRFAVDFYSKIYERRFSGRAERNARPPLMRESTLSAALHALDRVLDGVRTQPVFRRILRGYVRGEAVEAFAPGTDEWTAARELSWYLQRNSVPVTTLLVVLRGLATQAHDNCLGHTHPQGTDDAAVLDQGIKEVLHAAGTQMTTAMGSGWSIRSLNEILEEWCGTSA